MKKTTYRCLVWMAMLILIVSSCVEPLNKPSQSRDDGLYSISFRVRTEDDLLLTKAGEGGPLKGEDKEFSCMYMYCFDADGLYLGRFPASITQVETLDYTQNKTGKFIGEIPPSTARIHFVANADRPVGNDMIGMTEEQVMHNPDLVYVTKDDEISYWGYLREETSSDLADLFEPNTQGNPTVVVNMVRDRLQIEAGSNSYDSNIFYDDISWIVYNGLSRGFIAPYGLRESDDTFDSSYPYQQLRYTRTEPSGTTPASFWLSTVVTPYPDESCERFTTTEDKMVPFDRTKTTGDNPYRPLYVFDDYCLGSRPERVVKIIIRARYKASGDENGPNAAPYRYIPVCITEGYSDDPIPLKRGHRYELVIKSIPEAYGYLTDSEKSGFQKAAEALTFANGSLVDIPDEVIEVADGSFVMRVNYEMTYPLSKETFNSTAVLIQDNQSSVDVPFSVRKEGTSDRTFNFNESDWFDDEEHVAAYREKSFTWGAPLNQNPSIEIGNPLETTVSFPLDEVGSSLKQSTFNLKGYYTTLYEGQNVKHVLMRNIVLFSINKFQIQSGIYATSGNGYNSSGNLSLQPVPGQTGVYRLKFILPKGNNAYPALLYPLQIKFATKTLQPFAAYIEGERQGTGTTSGGQTTSTYNEAATGTWKDEVFGVQVRSTKPGEAPAKLAEQNTDTQWNYQSSDKYWNFWYTYPIASIPMDSSQQEIDGPEIWIDFKDVRNSGAFNVIPTNVGVYLYIEFFGEAQAVSYDPS